MLSTQSYAEDKSGITMSYQSIRIGVIGAGQMGKAIINGLLRDQTKLFSQIIASTSKSETASTLSKELGIAATCENNDIYSQSDLIILCVLPNVFFNFTPSNFKGIVLSIMSGVTIDDIRQCYPKAKGVYRAMPTVAASIGRSVTALACHDTEDIDIVKRVLETIGTVHQVKESLIPGVIAVSGSGIAILFEVMEALADAGVHEGLERRDAIRMVAETFVGAGEMALTTGKHPTELKDSVCSPGGQTIAGIRAFEKCGGKSAIMEGAIAAATKRSHS